MKKFVALFLIVTILCVTLNSCGNNESTEPSAVDKLSAEEYEIYSVLSTNLYTFKEPASVTVKSATKTEKGIYVIEVSAKNSFGVSSSEGFFIFSKNGWYDQVDDKEKLYTKSTLANAMYHASDEDKLAFILDLDTYACSYNAYTLNAALYEYKELRGWID